jgi:hypothetical protein
MSSDEIEAALQAAFNSCDVASCPLTEIQKQILLQVISEIQENSYADVANPLDELTPAELEAFLEFVKTQDQHNRTWKVQLLNDWLQQKDSGKVNFVRKRYGLQDNGIMLIIRFI